MSYSIQSYSLTKTYSGRAVVDQLCLRVERGAFYGFLGPNGAGKSTTIKMLTGIIAPTSGTARILDLDLTRNSLAIKRRIGVVRCAYEIYGSGSQVRICLPPCIPVPGNCLGSWGLNRRIASGSGFSTVCKTSHRAILHNRNLFLDRPFEGWMP